MKGSVMATQMKFSEYRPGMHPTHQKYEAWLIVDGKAVSYLSIMVSEKIDAERACICELETREGYKQQGYARQLMKQASKELGMTLATTGGYTPEGFDAFKGKLPIWKGYTEPAKPSYSQMTFVRDWDAHLGAE